MLTSRIYENKTMNGIKGTRQNNPVTFGEGISKKDFLVFYVK